MSGNLPSVCDARLTRFAEYLAGKAPPGRLPGRQHIDPVEIPDLLPHLLLLDVVPQPSGTFRYRVRLVGTYIVTLFGHDGTGKFVDETLRSAFGLRIIERYKEMVLTKKPQYIEGPLPSQGRGHISFQRLGFPLARNGEDVDMLVFVIVAVDKDHQVSTPEHPADP